MKSLITGSLLAMLLFVAIPSAAHAGSFSVYVAPPAVSFGFGYPAYYYPYVPAPPVYLATPYWYGGYRGYYGGHSHWRGHGHRGGWGGHRGGGYRGGHRGGGRHR
jgi:hypothetical protein